MYVVICYILALRVFLKPNLRGIQSTFKKKFHRRFLITIKFENFVANVTMKNIHFQGMPNYFLGGGGGGGKCPPKKLKNSLAALIF